MTKPSNHILTPAQGRSLDLFQQLYQQEEPVDIQFLHSCFCQIGLPRSPTDEKVYRHTVGQYSLSLQAGSLYNGKDWQDVSLPYGVAPRLILIYITTFAKRNQTRVVHVGNNMAEFLRKLGIPITGGKRGGITTFKKQAQALAACHIQIGFRDGQGRATTVNGHFVEQSSWDTFELWAADDEQQMTLWNSEVHLSQQFFDSIKEHSVPLDYTGVKLVHDNALALDIYSFLVHRLPRISHGKPLFLNWEMLREQFCPNYADSANGGFRKKFTTAMSKALMAYQDAKVERKTHGFMFKASPKAVPDKVISLK